MFNKILKGIILFFIFQTSLDAVTVKGTYGTGYQRDLSSDKNYLVIVTGPSTFIPLSASSGLQLEYLVLLSDQLPGVSFSSSASTVSSLLNFTCYSYFGFRQPTKKTGRFFYPFIGGTFSSNFQSQHKYIPGFELQVGMDLLFGDRFPKIDFSSRGCFSSISGESRPVVTLAFWCGFYYYGNSSWLSTGFRLSVGTLF